MHSALEAILQVHAFFRDGTGADRYFRDLSRLLEERGHRVAPFCARHQGDEPTPYARYFPEGALSAPGDRPGPLRALRDAGRFLYHLPARRRAAEIVRDFRPDVVHVHNLFHHLSPAVLGPLRASGAPVVMTLHDYKLICPNYSLYTQGATCTACRGGHFGAAVVRRCVRDSIAKSALCATENALHWMTGAYLRGVDRFIAPSRFVAERFVEFGFPEDRLSVVPHFTPESEGVGAEGVEEGDFVLFAGRLVAAKGVFTLLEAWRRSRVRRELRLVIAGQGPAAPLLARFVADHELAPGVEIVGQLDRATLGREMARAAAVVIPSEWWEPFGLVALEAMARGRCVIASRIGGLPEVIEDGVTGLLVPPGDPQALADALDSATRDPARRARLGEAGRRRARERHGADAHYQALLAVYGGGSGARPRP